MSKKPTSYSIKRFIKQLIFVSVGIGFVGHCCVLSAEGQTTEVRLREEPVFNSQFYYQEFGKNNKINVILCHGTGDMASRIWNDVIPNLVEDYRVITFDLPGFGRSEKKNKQYSPENYARFLKWLIDTNTSGPVYLVGHSMGGAISLYYAWAYPQKIDRLILVDAAGILHRAAYTKNSLNSLITGELKIGDKDILEKPLSTVRYLVNTTIEDLDNKLMPESLGKLLDVKTFREKALGGDPIKISGMALIHTDFSEIINNIKTPTFIIWGEKDTIAPLRTGKLLVKNIPGAVLDVMDELEHNPMLENPDEFIKLLKKDLSREPVKKINKKEDTVTSTRMKRLVAAKDVVITGDYKSIEVKDSKNIIIRNVNATQLEVINSHISIEFSNIHSDHIGIKAYDSVLQVTASSISGGIAIVTSNSKLDLAGVTLTGKKEVIFSDYNSTVVFSVCRINSFFQEKKYAHRILKLKKGEYY